MLSRFIPRLNFNIPPPGFEYSDETFALVVAPGVEPCSVSDAWTYFETHNIPPGMVRHAWAKRGGPFEHALAFDTNGDGDGVQSVPYTLEASAEDALKNAWTWYRRRAELSRRMKDAEWPAVLLWSEEDMVFGYSIPADMAALELLASEAQKRGLVALSLFTGWAAGLRDTVESLLRYHRQNLEGWQEASVETPVTTLLGFVAPGHLVPSEPDPEARAFIRIELRAVIGTLQMILGQKPDRQLEQDSRRDLERITDKYRKIVGKMEHERRAIGEASKELVDGLEQRCRELGEAQMRIIALESQQVLDQQRITDLEVQLHDAELETTRAAEFMDAIKAGADVMHRMERAITCDDVVLWLRNEINTDEARVIAHELEAVVDHLADVGLTPPVTDCREAFKRGVASNVDALQRHNASLMQWHTGAVADIRSLCKALAWPAEQVLNVIGKPEFGVWYAKAAALLSLRLRCCEIVGLDMQTEDDVRACLDTHIEGLNGAWRNLNASKEHLERQCSELMYPAHSLHSIVIDCGSAMSLDEASRWWADALDLKIVDPDEDGEGRYAVLSDAGSVRVEVQRHQPADVARHTGVHLDIRALRPHVTKDRLITRGAELLRTVTPKPGEPWYVMKAPTGHVFCVVQQPVYVDVAAALGKTPDELAAAVEEAATGPMEKLSDFMRSSPFSIEEIKATGRMRPDGTLVRPLVVVPDDTRAAYDSFITHDKLARALKSHLPEGTGLTYVGSASNAGPDLLIVVVLEDQAGVDANAIATAFGKTRPALAFGPVDLSELDTGINVAKATGVGALIVSVPVASSEKPRLTATRAGSYSKDAGSGYVYDVLICDRKIVRCRQADNDPDILLIKRVLDLPREESQRSVAAWADDVFGECNPLRAAARAAEEMQEFIEVLDLELGVDCKDVDHIIGRIASGRELSAEGRSRLLKEGADIITALWRFYAVTGNESAQHHVNSVMHTNRARLWLPDGTGCGYHVRIEETSSRLYLHCKALGLSTSVEIHNGDLERAKIDGLAELAAEIKQREETRS